MFKRILTGRIYVVIAPPSMYITQFMTWREAKDFAGLCGPHHHIVRDVTGRFSKRYVTKPYPVTNPYN